MSAGRSKHAPAQSHRRLDGTTLVVSAGVPDGELVHDLLIEDLASVIITPDPERGAADFETHRPSLLILALRSIEAAQHYYLELHRRCEALHATPHRTIVLCERADARRAFELCRQQYFDDYVVFWPTSHDPFRVRMAAIHALQQLGANGIGAGGGEIAVHARRLAALTGALQASMASGEEHIARVVDSVRRAHTDVDTSLRQLAERLDAEGRESAATSEARARIADTFDKMRKNALKPHFSGISEAVVPMREWMDDLNAQVAPAVRAAEAILSVGGETRPLVMIVEDDLFQHRLLAHQLGASGLDLLFASNGTGAFALLRHHQPDVILLDFNLPDMSGAEVLHRLKSAERTQSIPVILITGTSTKDVVVESRRAGAVDVMAKPLDTERLLASIREHLSPTSAP